MNRVEVKSVMASDTRIEYEYKVEGSWKQYFTGETFFVEYSSPINEIPAGVAIIPVLGTLLPMSWLFNAEISVDEIDEMFYNSIPEFKKGYIEMYPKLPLKGKLSASKITKNSVNGNKAAALFSGGVDAFNTLISHIDEKPSLITIWGADIATSNKAGWDIVEKHRSSVLREWEVEGFTIKSSFRKVGNEVLLSGCTMENAKDNWWHGFHHSIGMFALTAPIAYSHGFSRLYVASSFTNADKGKYTCASDPTIDNFVEFCGCNVVHDGYEYNRQDKIHRICEYSEKTGKKILLRVCWESSDGSNCCHCEKCYRTILGIYAERKNPVNFGFNYKESDFPEMMKRFKRRKNDITFRYTHVQNAMRKNYTIKNIDSSLKWFYKTDPLILERNSKIRAKIKRVLKKIKRKLVG